MILKDFNIDENDFEIYVNEMRKRNNILEKRFIRFDEYIKNNDFDKLIYRIVLEHNEDWRDKCYSEGCEPYPNNKLQFILDYVQFNGDLVKVKKLMSNFPNRIFEFSGYYFQDIYGQGVITRIYNKKDLKLMLQV